jgi:hypothetical protein
MTCQVIPSVVCQSPAPGASSQASVPESTSNCPNDQAPCGFRRIVDHDAPPSVLRLIVFGVTIQSRPAEAAAIAVKSW